MSLLRSNNRDKTSKSDKNGLRAKAGTMMLAGGLTAAFVVADGAALMGSASAAPNLAGLRACESGGNYATNTGNGYYGAYQFSASTWQSLGYSGLPSSASAAQQDAAVLQLAARSGWAQWPVCSVSSGSSGSTGSQAPVRASRGTARAPLPAKAVTRAPARTVATHAAAATTVQLPFAADEVLSAEQGHFRPEVKAWQARMAQRGWSITVDGFYGPQSSSVAAAFAAEKGVTETPGTLNKAGYVGAWTLKIT